MLAAISSFIVHIITSFISSFGYGGLIVLVGLESAAIPIPSEIIFPFSGYLVYQGVFTLVGVAFAGAVGSLIGSLVIYYLARYKGRALIEKYGGRVPGFHHGLKMSEDFFRKHGFAGLFVGRLLPVIRTYISIPAGLAKANVWSFSIFCFVGSFIWGLLLAWIGFALGSEWLVIGHYLEKFSYVIVIALVIALVYWWRTTNKKSPPEP